MKKRLLLLFFLFVCLIAGLAASYLINKNEMILGVKYFRDIKIEEEIEETQKIIIPDPVQIQITAVGDIMVHGPQIRAQYRPEIGKHDFTNNFQFVKPYLYRADIAIANLETTFAGEAKGYSSYPRFNSPDELADALKDAGFNVISTANNHTMDMGAEGMLRTIHVLERRGLGVIGTRKSKEDESYIIKDVKGIKVGLMAYTYETPKWGEYKTLNGLKVPKEVEDFIDTFNYDYLEKDMMKIRQRIEEMQQKGAEFIVLYIHWGEEYQRVPDFYQIKIAQTLANYGVDIIFGSHPHVLQPIELIESTIEDRQTLVVYSLGNFLSNQRYEILENRYTEDGIMIHVQVEKDFEKNRAAIKKVTYVPTWVHRYFQNGRLTYEILPLLDALGHKEQYHLVSNDSVWRAQNSLQNTVNIIDSSTTHIVPEPVLP